MRRMTGADAAGADRYLMSPGPREIAGLGCCVASDEKMGENSDIMGLTNREVEHVCATASHENEANSAWTAGMQSTATGRAVI